MKESANIDSSVVTQRNKPQYQYNRHILRLTLAKLSFVVLRTVSPKLCSLNLAKLLAVNYLPTETINIQQTVRHLNHHVHDLRKQT